ncbi:hypothetical protein [uncultured Rhodoferax sp.]|uniref:hypothetical protein n=1 Tax=uncultured Rhodoferax sp. TaxID=223188 RepID=UPI0025F79267|nr:hypothetical protein [uncultured Rhodoferax sp.]
MKTLKVTIELEMSVPDSWEVVPTSEGTPVLKLPHGTYMDLAVEPLFTGDPEGEWASTESEEELNEVLDMVESEEVRYTFVTH